MQVDGDLDLLVGALESFIEIQNENYGKKERERERKESFLQMNNLSIYNEISFNWISIHAISTWKCVANMDLFLKKTSSYLKLKFFQ